MPDITMPKLSDSMEEGTIVRWLKEDGAAIERGDELVEIETDKATMTYEAEVAGTLHVVASDGETLAVGAVIAQVLADGESPSSASGSTTRKATAAAVAPAPPARATAAARTVTAPATPRVQASPVARRLASALGVDLAQLQGSGPSGRIVKRDVEAAARGAEHPPAPQPAVASGDVAASAAREPATSAKGAVTTETLSRIQTTIARRMAEAKATMPEFTLTVDVDMDRAVELRAELKALDGDVTPSYNDFVVKACALALRRHPRANGSYRDGTFELYERVNVGVAVAASDALVVPTVFDADEKSLGAIARETRRLAAKARDGQLTPPELAGGTFSVSNLGMFGVTQFTAVLNPPQAAILAVGALELRPVVKDGQVVPGHRMTITLTCDHRILYGADAAAFLADIRAELEQPLRLTL